MEFITITEKGKISFYDPTRKNLEILGKTKTDDRIKQLYNFFKSDETELNIVTNSGDVITIIKDPDYIKVTRIGEDEDDTREFTYENTSENVSELLRQIEKIRKAEKAKMEKSKDIMVDGKLNRYYAIKLLSDEDIISKKFGIKIDDDEFRKVSLMEDTFIFIFNDELSVRPTDVNDMSDEELKIELSKYIVVEVNENEIRKLKRIDNTDLEQLRNESSEFAKVEKTIVKLFKHEYLDFKININVKLNFPQDTILNIKNSNEIYGMDVSIPKFRIEMIYPNENPVFANLDKKVKKISNEDDTKYSNFRIPIIKLSKIKQKKNDREFLKMEQLRFQTFLKTM